MDIILMIIFGLVLFAIGFAFIWIALALYALEGLLRARRSGPVPA